MRCASDDREDVGSLPAALVAGVGGRGGTGGCRRGYGGLRDAQGAVSRSPRHDEGGGDLGCPREGPWQRRGEGSIRQPWFAPASSISRHSVDEMRGKRVKRRCRIEGRKREPEGGGRDLQNHRNRARMTAATVNSDERLRPIGGAIWSEQKGRNEEGIWGYIREQTRQLIGALIARNQAREIRVETGKKWQERREMTGGSHLSGFFLFSFLLFLLIQLLNNFCSKCQKNMN